MAAIPEDDVTRIATECAFVNKRGAVGIRLEPAAAIVRQYGNQFRAPRRKRQPSPAETAATGVIGMPPGFAPNFCNA